MKYILSLLFKKEPENTKFKKGQKVFCCITHEVHGSKVCNGTIKRWAYKRKSYWAFSDIPSDWYLVEYENGQTKTLPEERLQDLSDYIAKEEIFLTSSAAAKKCADEGYQESARLILERQLINAKAFL